MDSAVAYFFGIPWLMRHWSSLARQHVSVSKVMAFYKIDIQLIITGRRWQCVYLRKLWS